MVAKLAFLATVAAVATSPASAARSLLCGGQFGAKATALASGASQTESSYALNPGDSAVATVEVTVPSGTNNFSGQSTAVASSLDAATSAEASNIQTGDYVSTLASASAEGLFASEAFADANSDAKYDSSAITNAFVISDYGGTARATSNAASEETSADATSNVAANGPVGFSQALGESNSAANIDSLSRSFVDASGTTSQAISESTALSASYGNAVASSDATATGGVSSNAESTSAATVADLRGNARANAKGRTQATANAIGTAIGSSVSRAVNLGRR